MLSHPQFFQLKRLLKDNIREVECPCGIRFYTCNTRSIYHSNACRQQFFRLKKLELVEFEKVQEQQIETTEIKEIKEEDEKTINELIAKSQLYSNKLKAI